MLSLLNAQHLSVYAVSCTKGKVGHVTSSAFRSFSGFIIALRNVYEKFIFWHLVSCNLNIIMIILFIQLLTICTGEGNKTDHQPMIYDPNKTSALNAVIMF
jgi:hypothetical protein